ncbi:MAG TPA: helix-turn-helix domain-containing protein [Steroidobacteraceae bacterium]
MPRASHTTLRELAESIELAIRELGTTIRRPLQAEFARGELTGPQRSVMQAVFHSDGLSIKELCQRVGLSHSTVSGIVDRLTARGMLDRQVNAIDRRMSRVVITETVRSFMQLTAPRLTAAPLIRALRRATPAERETVVSGLDLLRRLLGSE